MDIITSYCFLMKLLILSASYSNNKLLSSKDSSIGWDHDYRNENY